MIVFLIYLYFSSLHINIPDDKRDWAHELVPPFQSAEAHPSVLSAKPPKFDDTKEPHPEHDSTHSSKEANLSSTTARV